MKIITARYIALESYEKKSLQSSSAVTTSLCNEQDINQLITKHSYPRLEGYPLVSPLAGERRSGDVERFSETDIADGRFSRFRL